MPRVRFEVVLKQLFTWEHVCDLDLKHIRDSWQDLQEGQLGRGWVRHGLRVGERSADLQLVELNGFNFALLMVFITIFLKNRK